MNAQDLKNSILQLAVQGKLVEQRPEEGTAKELLAQIKAEKEQLIKDKKIKKEKPLPEITDEEIPFEIPESWEWVRLGEIEEINLGFTYRPEYTAEGVHFLSVKDISGGKIDFDNTQFVSEKTYEEASYGSKPRKGDILFGRVGTLGKPQIITSDERFCIFVSLGFLRDHTDILIKEYICSWMDSQLFWRQVHDKVKGATVKNLNTTWLKDFIVPIPPLEEQKRIVAKIEEILPYIEKYDKAYTKLETFNKKFPEDMKKSILQMAMQGKLVEQRSEEGTADELYEQIIAEKEGLIKDGKIKKEKPLAEISEDEVPFDIPDSWKWVRIGDLAWYLDAGKSPNCEKKPVENDEWGVITTTSIQEGYFDDKQNKILPNDYVVSDTMKVCVDDILITRAGPINRTGVVCRVHKVNYNLILSDKTVRINLTNNFICRDYIVATINSPLIRRGVIELMSGMDKQQVNISQDKIKRIIIPLPPLAEQKRIVAKLEEMLPYCDQLIK